MILFFELFSIVLLAVLLFWTIYNGSIIYVGIRNKRKNQTAPVASNTLEVLPSYSLIVPTKNEESVIRRCLDGIMNIDYPKDKMQVIVVTAIQQTTPAVYARNSNRNTLTILT